MKKISNAKEITLSGNTSIMFGNPKKTNGDMLIIGNFKNICGEAEWHGKHSSQNSWLDTLDMTRFSETIAVNLEMLINTIKNGHKIVFIGSSISIQYWTSLICNMAKMGYFTDDEFVPDSVIKKILKNQLIKIVDDKVYEDTARKYGDAKTTLSQSKINDRIKENINTLFNDLKKSKLMFSNIILNPPYNGSLHLEIFRHSLDLLSPDGHLTIVEPATWLINVRKNGKAKLYDDIKRRINGHVRSVVIENLNKDFGTGLYVPFSITDIDMSYTGPIDFTCCGERKIVNSLYDCNLIGNYQTIWSIIEKVQRYGDMMNNHITKENMGDDIWYAKYAEIVSGALANHNIDNSIAYTWDSLFDKTKNGEFYNALLNVSLLGDRVNEIFDTLPKSRQRGGGRSKVIRYSDKNADCIYGTKQELEDWKHFIFNNKLPLFLNIVLTIDQNNNSKEFLPWLVDKKYTDEEINQMFGFTEEEIQLIDSTLKKFERNSPWFKRYMCGVEKEEEETVATCEI